MPQSGLATERLEFGQHVTVSGLVQFQIRFVAWAELRPVPGDERRENAYERQRKPLRFFVAVSDTTPEFDADFIIRDAAGTEYEIKDITDLFNRHRDYEILAEQVDIGT